MTDDEQPGSEDGGRDAPASLAAGLAPPASAEERIVEILTGRGVLRRAPERRRRMALLLIAAAAAAFVSGLAVGSRVTSAAEKRPAPESLRPRALRFVLFLSPLPGEDAAGEPGRVAEYRRWAAEIRRHGRFVVGEKLEDGGRVVSSAGAGAAAAPVADGGPAGYFVVEAGSFEDAVAVARSCPHVKHGGRITVRAVAPV